MKMDRQVSDPKPYNVVERARQWDRAFSDDMRREDVERLLKIAPFKHMDPDSFPANTPLSGILLNETRILRYPPGGIIARQGDYGSSAFLLLSGEVKVVFDIAEEQLGRSSTKRKSLMQVFSQLWRNAALPEVRTRESYRQRQAGSSPENDEGRVIENAEAIFGQYHSLDLKAGAMFGELAALTRSQRAASIIAVNDCEVLEIKWQGLRDLMRYNKELRSYIDKLYRERNLTGYLSSLPLFRHLSEAELAQVSQATRFETHGKFDWHATFKSARKKSGGNLLASEPVVIREGEYADDLVMIQSGFARVSQSYNHGHRTVACLGRGDIFDLETMMENCTSDRQQPYRYTLRALGYIDILRIPVSIVKRFADLSAIASCKAEAGGQARAAMDMAGIEKTDLLNFFVENRFVNGRKTMLINLERCVGCDDCVTACANAHDNNPRFIRHGIRHGKYMVANACMHCSDPVCMLGCPTGAIHRRATGEVVINDVTCIGCATCANSCPYNNIRMVDVRSEEGSLLLDDKFNPIVKATKCDFCYEQIVAPACEYACPHDALKRIDIRNLDELSEWMN